MFPRHPDQMSHVKIVQMVKKLDFSKYILHMQKVVAAPSAAPWGMGSDGYAKWWRSPGCHLLNCLVISLHSKKADAGSFHSFPSMQDGDYKSIKVKIH